MGRYRHPVYLEGKLIVNWRRQLTPTERRLVARYERELRELEARARAIRMERRLIQNRAYARGKK